MQQRPYDFAQNRIWETMQNTDSAKFWMKASHQKFLSARPEIDAVSTFGKLMKRLYVLQESETLQKRIERSRAA